MHFWTRITVGLLVSAVLATGIAAKKKPAKPAAANFSYYLLTLSWAPDFCAIPTNPKSPAECGKGRNVGFVVHGLWPQLDQGRLPQRCGGNPVSSDLVVVMLNYIPTEGLIQHEWSCHGTQSGLNQADYFAAMRKARDSVKIPPEFASLNRSVKWSPAEIEAKFEAANPGFPKGAFRTSCTKGSLQEARICFSKDLTPQACTASAGECNMQSMTVLPPQ